MREFIIENMVNVETIGLAEIVINNIVAMLVAFFIMFTYKLTYSGPSYSKKFNVSLGAIIITTTMIMSVISNNIALSLGMVGALSIIRFRTAVKDVKDATFIFWSIAAGIGCGVAQYTLVAVGSIFLLVFYLLTTQVADSEKQLMIVEGKPECHNEILAAIEEHLHGKAHLTMKNITESSCEMIFKIDTKILKTANETEMIDIGERLLKIDGVRRFNLVEQQDSISR